ncbi:MAG TPA: cytochrome c [Candidatus Acidoferrum sp.]|nr:cytochrome c [Candidatus Acidoferrum sp.]
MRIVVSLVLLVAVVGCAKNSRGASAAASASAAAMRNPASASDGATVYLTDCSSCHQADGQGVSGAFPPLAGNAVVTGNPVAVIAIVKNGLEGRVTVNDLAYSGIMPSWKGQIPDDQLAAVISYIRSAWNNHAPGVSVDQVRSIK